MWAAAQSQPAMVEALLAHGADVDARSHGQRLGAQGDGRAAPEELDAAADSRRCSTPRAKAASTARSTLVAAGAAVDCTDPDGITPLLERAA